MSRARRTDGRAPTGPAADLRALARRVAAVLAARSARPVASTGPAGGLVAAMSTVETPSSGRARRSSTFASLRGSSPNGKVAAEHTDTWHLVERAQTGDGEAFGLLYDRYLDTVFRFIYFRVDDRALAEDLTSETFLRALRRISTITYQGRDIGAWFVTIARNLILDHLKSARHRLETPAADTPENADPAPSPEGAVLDTLTSERLMAAVRQLGEEQRDCILLRFVHGFSVSETAEVMGKNDGAVKALQHRAVRKLADLLDGERE